MKGLVLYEMYKLKSAYLRNLLMVGVLYAVLTVAMKQEFLLYMLVWMMGFYAMGSMAMDEGWNRFARALPVSSRQLAGAKFLSTGAMILIGDAYALVVGAAIRTIIGGDFREVCLAVIMVSLLAMLLMAVMLPCALKWGVERARNTMLLVFAALFGSALLLNGRVSLNGFDSWMDNHILLAVGMLTAVTAAGCVAGWLAMAKIYEGKED